MTQTAAVCVAAVLSLAATLSGLSGQARANPNPSPNLSPNPDINASANASANPNDTATATAATQAGLSEEALIALRSLSATQQTGQTSGQGSLAGVADEFFVDAHEEAVATPVVTGEPRQSTAQQSTAQGVTADKLILNNPVVDQAQILSTAEREALSQQLRAIYEQGLAQAAVVIVPTTGGVPIFDYAMSVADQWQLGRADTDDGLLMLVAINDRELYILTGYGLEGVIPDAIANRIIREDITPLFRQGDYAGGIAAGISRIQARLKADPQALARADAEYSQASPNEGEFEGGLFFVALIFGFFLTNILGRVLGASIVSGVFLLLAMGMGMSLLLSLFLAAVLWIFLLVGMAGLNQASQRQRRGGGGGFGGGGFGGGSGGGSSGGFGGGGFGGGGGGFGGGGFGGGGGGFGGGGAGGSW